MEEDLKGPGIDTDVENFGTWDAEKGGKTWDAMKCANTTSSNLIQSLDAQKEWDEDDQSLDAKKELDENGQPLDAKKEWDKNVTPFFAWNVQEEQPNRNDWKNKMMEILMDPKVPYEEKERIRRLLDGF